MDMDMYTFPIASENLELTVGILVHIHKNALKKKGV